MTKQNMIDKMVRDFGMENKHVIEFFQWCEDNPDTDCTDAYNTATHRAVMDILNGSERIW